MRDHSECDQPYNDALARGRDGYAEYVLQRCDLAHGHLTPPTDPAPTTEENEQ